MTQEQYAKKSSAPSNPLKKLKTAPSALKPHHELSVYRDCVTSLRWLSAEALISGSYDHTVRVTDLEKGEQRSMIDFESNVVSAVAAYGDVIVTGHDDAYIRIWDQRSSNKSTRILKSHNNWISSIQFHPDN